MDLSELQISDIISEAASEKKKTGENKLIVSQTTPAFENEAEMNIKVDFYSKRKSDSNVFTENSKQMA